MVTIIIITQIVNFKRNFHIILLKRTEENNLNKHQEILELILYYYGK